MDIPELTDRERLTLLERAQELHDLTLLQHTDMLARHETAHADHAQRLQRLDDLSAQQTLTHRRIAEGFDRLETTLVAIKDLLERWNGRA